MRKDNELLRAVFKRENRFNIVMIVGFLLALIWVFGIDSIDAREINDIKVYERLFEGFYEE